MPPSGRPSLTDYQQLAAFRLALRRSIAITETNARRAGLTPQQHQALLSIKGGHPDRQRISIGELAAHLLLKNHSAVELVDRLVKAGLAERAPSDQDRRRILVSLTARGEALLDEVSAASLAQLRAAPEILRAALAISGPDEAPSKRS